MDLLLLVIITKRAAPNDNRPTSIRRRQSGNEDDLLYSLCDVEIITVHTSTPFTTTITSRAILLGDDGFVPGMDGS